MLSWQGFSGSLDWGVLAQATMLQLTTAVLQKCTVWLLIVDVVGQLLATLMIMPGCFRHVTQIADKTPCKLVLHALHLVQLCCVWIWTDADFCTMACCWGQAVMANACCRQRSLLPLLLLLFGCW